MRARIPFTLTIAVLLTTQLGAQVWPQPRGKAYVKLYEYWLRFDEHYTDQGELDPNLTSGIYNTSLYAEYGLTERITGVVNLPFFSRNVTNNLLSQTTGEVLQAGEELNGVGDANLGVRYALNRPGSSIPLAASLTLGLPLGEESAGELGNLQTGDGEFNQLVQLHAGGSFPLGGAAGYWQTRAGVNNRSNGFSDEWHYGLEVGAGVFERNLWLILRLNGVNSFFNGEAGAGSFNQTGIFANNAEYVAVGGELNYYVTRRFGVSGGVGGLLSGRIIAAAPAYTAGVFVDLAR